MLVKYAASKSSPELPPGIDISSLLNLTSHLLLVARSQGF